MKMVLNMSVETYLDTAKQIAILITTDSTVCDSELSAIRTDVGKIRINIHFCL